MHTNTHTYSCGQKFPYTCREHVLYVMAVKSFLQPLYFCDGIKYIHAFGVFYKFIMGLLKTLQICWVNIHTAKLTIGYMALGHFHLN